VQKSGAEVGPEPSLLAAGNLFGEMLGGFGESVELIAVELDIVCGVLVSGRAVWVIPGQAIIRG